MRHLDKTHKTNALHYEFTIEYMKTCLKWAERETQDESEEVMRERVGERDREREKEREREGGEASSFLRLDLVSESLNLFLCFLLVLSLSASSLFKHLILVISLAFSLVLQP